ncbi:hypothetical protein [Caloramator sp. Dgby_cultured_2]|uniref:hypothetical protein n=1 Tax=Caloramator sp. Dgby_cultured_2 TaxID=3029174 RepID=UPI00237E2EDE|nr:hypothetical protein [Caloramator sp. Dgby_cultured_2]WDU82289.1 hypothetical protein PWK10_11350 [Caloramator sp. Dgby_cultured_2]
MYRIDNLVKEDIFDLESDLNKGFGKKIRLMMNPDISEDESPTYILKNAEVSFNNNKIDIKLFVINDDGNEQIFEISEITKFMYSYGNNLCKYRLFKSYSETYTFILYY